MTRTQRPRRGLPQIVKAEAHGPLVVVEGTDGVGRSTQVELLVPWLEANGHAVVPTGWNRSLLVSKLITSQKEGTLLNKITYAMLYATDFADRLERVVIPAMRSGIVVVADRYVPTAIARAVARDVHRAWIDGIYAFAPRPDVTFYLRIDPQALLRRTLHRGALNYWESGMDQHMGEDIHESFLRYQARLVEQYDAMAEENRWHILDAHKPVREIQIAIRKSLASMLRIPDPQIERGLDGIGGRRTEKVDA